MANQAVVFPIARGVLWDRTSVESPRYLRPSDVVPPIYVSPSAIKSLLESCLNTTAIGLTDKSTSSYSSSIERLLSVKPIRQFDKYTRNGLPLFSQSPWRAIVGPSNYVTQISDSVDTPPASKVPFGKGVDSILSIPISCRTDVGDGLLFDKDTTVNLIKNLEKSLEYGRDCTLRSCIRLRAASKVEREHNLVNGSFRFEAIIPDYSFQAVKIRNLPILSTPLSVNLTRQNGDEARELGPRMGYLTMNQTRKIVPLLETDTASTMTPMVGVWLSVNDCDAGTDIATDFMKHPFVWGACVRFLKNKKVHDRAYVDDNTFLLMNFGHLSISFYEMTCMSPHAHEGNNESDDFICCDFSVDLSMDTSKGNEANLEPIVCKFRPLSQVDRIKSFREATGRQGDRGRVTNNMTLPGQSVSASVNYASMTADQLSDITKKMLSETTTNFLENNTPLPRDSKEIINMRNSVESSSALTGSRSGDPRYEVRLNTNGGDSIVVTDPAIESARGNAGASSSLVNLSSGTPPPFTCASNTPTFPAEVVLAQQMQIDALRQQVFDLQSQIQTMNQLMARSIDLSTATTAAVASSSNSKIVEPNLVSEKDEKSAVNSDLKAAILSEASMEDRGVVHKELVVRDDNIDQALVQVAGEEDLRPMQVITVESDEYSLLSAAEEESIKAIRSSYSRINPLNSAALNHPVLRLNSETETDLMEPSILSQKLLGGSAFPAPSVEYDSDDLIVDDDEEKLRELNSISEAANAPVSTSRKKEVKASSKKKASTGTSTASSGNQLVVASQEIVVPRSVNADESEGASALETDSILAIQNRYL